MHVMPGDDERKHQRRAGAVVRGDARQNENAGADDRAHAEARELDGTEDAAQAIVAAKLFEQDACAACVMNSWLGMSAFALTDSAYPTIAALCDAVPSSPASSRSTVALRRRRIAATRTDRPERPAARSPGPARSSASYTGSESAMMATAVTIYSAGNTG